MAAQLKEGDAVQVVDREATPADEKNSIFFNHFRSLTGTLEKVYPDKRATVVVDIDSLPEGIRDRHQELTQAAKQKWLDGLSNEARNRLTAEEQKFQMRYTIMVSLNDLVEQGSAPARKAPGKAANEAGAPAKAEEPRVLSHKDLDAAEEEFLRSRQQK